MLIQLVCRRQHQLAFVVRDFGMPKLPGSVQLCGAPDNDSPQPETSSRIEMSQDIYLVSKAAAVAAPVAVVLSSRGNSSLILLNPTAEKLYSFKSLTLFIRRTSNNPDQQANISMK